MIDATTTLLSVTSLEMIFNEHKDTGTQSLKYNYQRKVAEYSPTLPPLLVKSVIYSIIGVRNREC